MKSCCTKSWIIVSLQHEQIVGQRGPCYNRLVCHGGERGSTDHPGPGTRLTITMVRVEPGLTCRIPNSQTYFKFQQIAQGWCQDGAGCVNQVQSTRIMVRLWGRMKQLLNPSRALPETRRTGRQVRRPSYNQERRCQIFPSQPTLISILIVRRGTD